MENSTEDLIRRVTKYAKKSVKKSRFEHSVRTAEMCEKLCRRYGLDGRLGYLAGIGHDICKELSETEMLELAAQDGMPVADIEREKPGPFLHGRAAAQVLQSKFGINNAELLEAVRRHTCGARGLCALAKILYVADKIEPGREYVDAAYYAQIEGLSLDELALKVLSGHADYLRAKGKNLSPLDGEFLAEIEDSVKKGCAKSGAALE